MQTFWILRRSESEWGAPTYEEVRDAIVGAIDVIKAEKSRGSIPGGRISGDLRSISNLKKLAIVSDLHGDYDSLAQILKMVNYGEFFADSLNKMIFLGDHVDRGDNSVGVINSVCQLKLAYPASVVLMRGNHEAPSEFPFNSHDFPFRLEEQFGKSDGADVYRKALQLFRELTLVTIVAGKLLIVHGGLPTEAEVLNDHTAMLSSAQEHRMRSRVLEQLLWNDPREIDSSPPWESSRRGLGRHFGAEITARWLAVTGCRCVIRGHEPCEGFRLNHGGRIMTLFSSRAPYPMFKAAFLTLNMADLEQVSDAGDLVPFVRYLE